ATAHDHMSTKGSSSGKKKELTPNEIRETLFGDIPLDQWTGKGTSAEGFPWDAFFTARSQVVAGKVSEAVASWRQILGCGGLESRQYLQALHFLWEDREAAPAGAGQR